MHAIINPLVIHAPSSNAAGSRSQSAIWNSLMQNTVAPSSHYQQQARMPKFEDLGPTRPREPPSWSFYVSRTNRMGGLYKTKIPNDRSVANGAAVGAGPAAPGRVAPAVPGPVASGGVPAAPGGVPAAPGPLPVEPPGRVASSSNAARANQSQTSEDRVEEVQKAVFKFFTENNILDAPRGEFDWWLAEKGYNFTAQELEDSFSIMLEKHLIICDLDHIFFVI